MRGKMVTADSNLRCEIKPAINLNERIDVIAPDILVLHYTGMPSGEQALNWLCVEESQVSCHYLIHDDGRIVQMVPENKRAWHAGKSSWHGSEDINSRSIGIEIVNPGHDNGYPDFPDIQMGAVIELCQDILQRKEIRPRNVVAHSDIAPRRKQDPGEKFSWELLYKNNIGHWVEPSQISDGRFFQLGDSGQPVEALQSLLSVYGYGIEINGQYDDLTKACIVAFQRHFRQSKVDGIADASTIDTLYRLNKSLEVVA